MKNLKKFTRLLTIGNIFSLFLILTTMLSTEVFKPNTTRILIFIMLILNFISFWVVLNYEEKIIKEVDKKW